MFDFNLRYLRFGKGVGRIANITVSFSWIFMFIIGSIFIMIGYSIISNYQQTEEVKLNLKQKLTISNILDKVGRTSGIEENSLVFTQGLFRDTFLKVECVENFSILNMNGNLDPNNNFLKEFSTFNIQIKKSKIPNAYFAIGNYKIPFKVSNLLSIVSKKNLLIIDKNSPLSERFLYLLNKGSFNDLSYMVVDFKKDWDLGYFTDLVKEKNLFSIVFVTDKNTYDSNYNSYNLLDIKNFENYFLIIDEQNSFTSDNKNLPKSYGTLIYKNKLGLERNFSFINYDGSFSIPLMAAFSSPEAFECANVNLLSKAKQVYKYYILKSDYLYNLAKINGSQVCSKSLEFGADDKYKQVGDALKDIYLKLNTTGFGDKSSLFNMLEELERREQELIKYNCIEVY